MERGKAFSIMLGRLRQELRDAYGIKMTGGLLTATSSAAVAAFRERPLYRPGLVLHNRRQACLCRN
jgi:hypothetical protein